MPFPRTWSEELIAEWLQLRGYLVEIGIPISSPKAGGRNEADVVDAKFRDGILEIIHVEVGTLPGGAEQSKETFRKKFSEEVRDSIVNYFAQRLEIKTFENVNYKGICVLVYASRPTLEALLNFVKETKKEVEIKELSEFIKDEIIPTIQNWKKHPPHSPKTRGKEITLPESHWLLQLIDYLDRKQLLK
ncbi:hypothetical protein TOPB45_0733 [Thermodesulfobacterium geofontis OPF15]|uniref:Uncharacterized protein n=1 Tax=Thermodesulfobacterium geofontis (strain OPF15) TaxID=795359 RepID=F8C567_THEGP|nr:hypothetical protein [Thermodesulfobacterium geofontis]AEH22834.1 hypothetical protein TOPB45_0733 [Thermodesulfobacterium geofontis OPF15]